VGYDNNLFMGSTGGRLYSLILDPKLSQPMIKWEVMAGGPISAAPVLYDRYNLLIASQGGLVASCFAKDKAYQWSYKTSGARPLDKGPTAAGGHVYQYCDGKGITALDAENGGELWVHPDGLAFAAHSEGGDVILQQIISARNQLNQPPIDESTLDRPNFERKEIVDPLENDPLRSRRDLDNSKPKNEAKKDEK
jgi:hypothetical protein